MVDADCPRPAAVARIVMHATTSALRIVDRPVPPSPLPPTAPPATPIAAHPAGGRSPAESHTPEKGSSWITTIRWTNNCEACLPLGGGDRKVIPDHRCELVAQPAVSRLVVEPAVPVQFQIQARDVERRERHGELPHTRGKVRGDRLQQHA